MKRKDEYESPCDKLGDPCYWIEDYDSWWGTTDVYCANCSRRRDWSKKELANDDKR